MNALFLLTYIKKLILSWINIVFVHFHIKFIINIKKILNKISILMSYEKSYIPTLYTYDYLNTINTNFS